MNQISVKIALSSESIPVGNLAMRRGKMYFSFDPDFIARGLNISPIYLPVVPGVQQVGKDFFDGLPGVFSDSLPDGWGRWVLDRALTERDISLAEITVLDRLAYVGAHGFGALTYYPINDRLDKSKGKINLESIAKAIRQVLSGNSTEVIEMLVHLGGSSGGARPKAAVGYNPATDEMVDDDITLPEGFEHWLIKFPSSYDPSDIARIEMAYYEMAIAAGLEMMPCRLFTDESGRVYFGTKRFDRTQNGRLHLHSAAGLMNDNFRTSNMDYGNVMDAVRQLENDLTAPAKVLRLAAFNVFAHNRDDHSKNISFLMNATGKWRLAPAYDLTFSQSSNGYHSMFVAGESKHPGTAQLLELAYDFGINNSRQIIDEVRETVQRWSDFADKHEVPEGTKAQIDKLLNP